MLRLLLISSFPVKFLQPSQASIPHLSPSLPSRLAVGAVDCSVFALFFGPFIHLSVHLLTD